MRARALKDFGWFGLTIAPARNEQTINREGMITTDDSRLCVYVIPVEEGLLIAQQVAQCAGAQCPGPVTSKMPCPRWS